MRHTLALLLSFIATLLNAQTSVTDLSDEFTDTASIRNWKLFHQAEGFPDKIKKMEINANGNGLLVLEPKASGWYADYQAPFLFKTVTGNFDVRAKLKVSGTNNELPLADWSLAGLMIRQPKRTIKENWQPRQENWLFITTGIAHQLNLPVVEVKTTNNSLSNLKLRPAKTGWVEMRIVRIDAAFILMRRYEGGSWEVLERFYRPLMQGPLQVGINAYSGWETLPVELKNDPKKHNETIAETPADLVIQVDYIRFKKPAIDIKTLSPAFNDQYAKTLYYTPANLLTDFNISNEEVLKIIGD